LLYSLEKNLLFGYTKTVANDLRLQIYKNKKCTFLFLLELDYELIN